MRLSPGRRAVIAGIAALSAAAAVAGAQAAGAAPRELRWAPASSATVHPGVSVSMAQVACRVGFVLSDGVNAYVAVPASCSGVSDGQPTDGCSEAQVPYGVTATVAGARYPGRLVFSSFTEMAKRGVRNPDECAMNGLSLIKLDRRDVARTNPSIPVVGGPSGVSSGSPSPGDMLTLYVSAPCQALELQNGNGGWSNTVLPSTAVTRVDVGAPVLDGAGRGVGMLAQVPQMQGGPASVGDLARELAFLHTVRGFGRVRLANGTVAPVG
jgi:hypothetical protein